MSSPLKVNKFPVNNEGNIVNVYVDVVSVVIQVTQEGKEGVRV